MLRKRKHPIDFHRDSFITSTKESKRGKARGTRSLVGSTYWERLKAELLFRELESWPPPKKSFHRPFEVGLDILVSLRRSIFCTMAHHSRMYDRVAFEKCLTSLINAGAIYYLDLWESDLLSSDCKNKKMRIPSSSRSSKPPSATGRASISHPSQPLETSSAPRLV